MVYGRLCGGIPDVELMLKSWVKVGKGVEVVVGERAAIGRVVTLLLAGSVIGTKASVSEQAGIEEEAMNALEEFEKKEEEE